MSETDARTDGPASGPTTDERLRAIEAQLRSISRWVTWLGFLSVVVLIVLLLDTVVVG